MSLNSVLDETSWAKHPEANALNQAHGHTNLELNKILGWDNLDCVRVFAFTCANNAQCLRLWVEDQTYQPALSISCLNFLNRLTECAGIRKRTATVFLRLISVRHRKAKSFDIGAHAPIQPHESEVLQVLLALRLKEVRLRIALDGLSELASEKRWLA